MKVKAKNIIAFFLILVILSGIVQSFVSTSEGKPGNLVVDQAYWLRLANNAWNYFQPGVGVDSTTGLHSAGLGYPYFTDWDLGIYIQAIIDANRLGILGKGGTWGADARFNKILSFLQTRQLTSNGVPYCWYQSANGKPNGNNPQYAADSGELLVALNNLRVFRPDLAGAINNIVYNYTNYTLLEEAVDVLSSSKNLYDYYVASGFAGFWPSRFSTLASSILNNIVSAPTVSTYGVTLPTSKLMCEPLFLSVFNLASNVKLNVLAEKVYLAHEARYNATGKFVAFSEGNTGQDNPSYVYEWVVKEDGSTWTIDDGKDKVGITPIIYFKSVVGLLAMHYTPFTEKMASYVESHLPTPTRGYSDGIDENGRVNTFDIDKTNGMIIQTAVHSIYKSQSPASSPSPSSNPTQSTIPSPSATQTQSTTPTTNPTSTTTEFPSSTQISYASPSPNSSQAPSNSQPASPPSKPPTSSTNSTPSTLQPPTPTGPNQGTQIAIYSLYYVLVVFVSIVFATGTIVLFKKQHQRIKSLFSYLSNLFVFLFCFRNGSWIS